MPCFVCSHDNASLPASRRSQYFFASQYTPRLHIILTTSLVFSSLIVSLLTCDLGIVLELTGGLSATALAFIFPAVCFLKLAKEGEGKALKLGVGRRRGGGARGANGAARTGRYQPLSTSADGAEGERDTLADLEDAEGPRRHAHTHARSGSNMSLEGDYPDGQGDDEYEGEESIPIADLELPLRPGAPIRTRSASLSAGGGEGAHNGFTPSSSSPARLFGSNSGGGPFQSRSSLLDAAAWTDGEYWYGCYCWWTSTKPLAVLCAAFGTLVLAISVVQALWKLFTGEGRGDGAGGTC